MVYTVHTWHTPYMLPPVWMFKAIVQIWCGAETPLSYRLSIKEVLLILRQATKSSHPTKAQHTATSTHRKARWLIVYREELWSVPEDIYFIHTPIHPLPLEVCGLLCGSRDVWIQFRGWLWLYSGTADFLHCMVAKPHGTEQEAQMRVNQRVLDPLLAICSIALYVLNWVHRSTG